LSVIVRVDDRGRILIPKSIREKINLRRGCYVRIMVENGKLILEPLKSIAENFYGVFRVDVWPDDLDEFIIKVIEKWWRKRVM